MTVADAARELGISPRRVWSLIASGRLAAQKVGQGWLRNTHGVPAHVIANMQQNMLMERLPTFWKCSFIFQQ